MDYNKFELWLHALHRFTCTHKTHNERHCCTMINNTTYHLANICFNANIRSSSNKNNDKTIAMKENQKIPVIWQSNEILFALISITSMILKYLIFKIVNRILIQTNHNISFWTSISMNKKINNYSIQFWPFVIWLFFQVSGNRGFRL